MAAEQLRELFTVIEGGAEVAIENVETFAPDVEIPGAAELLGKTETVTLGNGAAAEVSQLVTETSATTAETAGVGLLAMELPTACAIAAPFLGLYAGYTLYNLTPEFWDAIAENLMNAGQTVGGKVRAFLNSSTGEVGLTEETLEIFKDTFYEFGTYNALPLNPDYTSQVQPVNHYMGFNLNIAKQVVATTNIYKLNGTFASGHLNPHITQSQDTVYQLVMRELNGSSKGWNMCLYSTKPFSGNYDFQGEPWGGIYSTSNNYTDGSTFHYWTYGDGSINGYYYGAVNFIDINSAVTLPSTMSLGTLTPWLAGWLLLWNGANPNVQPDAVLPTQQDPITTTYPDLTPWNLPVELPTIFPVEIPVNNPNPTQQEAQNPNPDPEPSPFLDWLLQVLPQPEPNPNPQPEPVPEPDPDPQPVPEPLPVIDPVEIDPDPVDPNKPIPPSPIPIIPDLPTTVDSNAMFTVYAPSLSQLNAFGGWLWSNNIIDMLLRIWQNPLEGIIAFQKVYAVPTVGTSSNIIVGYVDSQVSAPVVTSQFVTVNCGTLTVDEILHNATDYPPYTMMHIYLPFIGIVELDCNEFMNGSITVTYHIDVYTGTCLVEVASTRSPDMATPTIIYTFSGNASQQLPLTSSNFGGALNALVSTVSGVARMGSGGALNAISGLSTIGHSISHEMIHIAHSGDLSANAGIMALRTPYLIIGRRNSYDANAYNELYGYPANKTVYLGNCSGFTRVKAGFLRSKATEEEKQEIMDLLKKGVIL